MPGLSPKSQKNAVDKLKKKEKKDKEAAQNYAEIPKVTANTGAKVALARSVSAFDKLMARGSHKVPKPVDGSSAEKEGSDVDEIPEFLTPGPYRSHFGRAYSEHFGSTPDLSRSKSQKRSASDVSSPSSPQSLTEKKNRMSGIPIKY